MTRARSTLGAFAVLGLVGAAGCGEADILNPTEESKGSPTAACDATQYPCGPYGVDEGLVIDDLQFVGQRDENHNGDVLDDPVRALRLSDYYKDKNIKVLVVMVAAEWCGPCRAEQAGLVQMYKDYQAANAGVAFLETIIENNSYKPADMSVVTRWANQYHVPFDMAVDPTVALGPYYPQRAFPMQMVIQTSDMAIAWQHNGLANEAVKGVIDSLLPSPVKRFLLVAALLAGCPGPGATPDHPTGGPADGVGQGAAATDFALRDVEGRTVRLSDYQGKVVLIDFWATWCIPCEAEIPHLQQLYEANKDKGFVVLAISMDGPETIAGVGPFVQRYRLTFPVLLDEETRVVGVYNPKRTAPLSVLIDRSGRIAKVRQGYSAGDEVHIAEEVTRLLGSS